MENALTDLVPVHGNLASKFSRKIHRVSENPHAKPYPQYLVLGLDILPKLLFLLKILLLL